MRAYRKQSPVVKAMKETFSEGVNGAKKGIKEELGKIAVVVQILAPVVLCAVGVQWYVMLVFSALLYVITKYLSELSYKLNNITHRGIPVPEKRFTSISSEDGTVNLDEVDAEQAILYLCEVEDYLEMKGLLKHGRT